MRVINPAALPADVDPYIAIAGEILNIELSELRFIDGKYLPKDQWVHGYPKITSDGVEYTIKGTSGIIYVTVDINIQEFIPKLMAAITRLESNYLSDENHYSVYRAHNHGSILIKPNKQLMPVKIGRVSARMYRRVMAGGKPKLNNPSKYLYSWTVLRTDYNSDDQSKDYDYITRYMIENVCSILFDSLGIYKLQHNSIVYSSLNEHLIGRDNFIDHKSFYILRGANPIQLALSEHHYEINTEKLRKISDKLYDAKYEDLNLIGARINAITGEILYKPDNLGKCSICESVLWGDNYVLDRSIDIEQDTNCYAVCPICLHTSPPTPPLEHKFCRTLRVKFPLTAEEYIKKYIPDPRADIILELQKGYIVDTIQLEDKSIKYILIGDKYVAIDGLIYAQFGLFKYPKFANRKVCSVGLL